MAVQCKTCFHWQRRGVFVPTIGCTAFEDEQLGHRTLLVTIASAISLAKLGRCPVYLQPIQHPDSYRADDLPIEENPS